METRFPARFFASSSAALSPKGITLLRSICLVTGISSDALNASRTYTRPGLADAAIEVLDLLGLREVVVAGWSLGGHIALEMSAQWSGIRGLLVSGAPPVSRHNMAEGFIPTPHMSLAGQQYLGPSEIDAFGEAIFARGYRSRFDAR
jgi:pimeloyl-ACP methyl ester carboxylesterase